jgi:hypothetical protein
MTITPQVVTCDQCGNDITVTNYAAEYMVTLSAQPRRHASGTTFAVGRRNPLPAAQHFCNMTCLRDWVQSTGTQT